MHVGRVKGGGTRMQFGGGLAAYAPLFNVRRSDGSSWTVVM